MEEKLITYTLERDGKVFVVEHVPARVSKETGEAFFSPETVEQNCLLKLRYALAQEPTVSRSVTAGMTDAEFEAWLVAQGAVPMSQERRAALQLSWSGVEG